MDPFTHRFDWIPPALKNTKRMERRGSRMALVSTPEVTEAIARIRAELEAVLRGRELPLFGEDAIQRDLVWLVDEGAVEVTWTDLGPDDRKGCGNRDLVNLAAILDDAVASIVRGPRKARARLPGLVYVDDRQIARASERRVRK